MRAKNAYYNCLKLTSALLVTICLVFCLSAAAYEMTYTYDDAGRLTEVSYTGANTITYTYDNAGNMLNRRINDPSCLHHGDVDANGQITAQDAQQAFYIILGLITPTPEQACAADCNYDGSVTSNDAQAIFLIVLYGGECVDGQFSYHN